MDGQFEDTPRVLHLITRFENGGAETTTVNALSALKNAPVSYDLRLGVGHEHNEERLAAIADIGISTVVFRSIRHYNPFTALIAVFAVRRYLRREEIDILHTHSTEAGIIGRFAAFLEGTPVVIHEIHGDPVTEDRNPILNVFVTWMERLAAPTANSIIVKSQQIKQAYLSRGIGTPDKYELIYHGINLQKFTVAVDQQAENNEQKRPRIIFIGRLTDGKGLFDLLDAVERLEPSVDVWIVGSGPLSEPLQAEIDRRKLQSTVELLGYREDIPSLLAQSDVLVLPSYREGTPRVISEALASGTPVVSTDIAGIPEQVQDEKTGYLVQPGDIEALTNRIQLLLTDENRRRNFANRAQDHAEIFSVERSKSEYQSLYRRLIQPTSSTPDICD